MASKPIDSKHTYACDSCGYLTRYAGALVIHIRTKHGRKVSKPEFDGITLRQAEALTKKFQAR